MTRGVLILRVLVEDILYIIYGIDIFIYRYTVCSGTCAQQLRGRVVRFLNADVAVIIIITSLLFLCYLNLFRCFMPIPCR